MGEGKDAPAQLVPDQQVQALIEVDHRVEQSRRSQQECQANKAECYEGRAPDPKVIPAGSGSRVPEHAGG